jgi:hypothetical protein
MGPVALVSVALIYSQNPRYDTKALFEFCVLRFTTGDALSMESSCDGITAEIARHLFLPHRLSVTASRGRVLWAKSILGRPLTGFCRQHFILLWHACGVEDATWVGNRNEC